MGAIFRIMKTKSRHSKKPSLLFVIPSLSRGGAERVLTALANHFSLSGIHTVIASLNVCEPAYPIHDDVKVVYLAARHQTFFGSRAYYMLVTFQRLIALMLRYQPGCIVSFITSANIWAGIAGRITATPFIVSERTTPNRTINQFNYLKRRIVAGLYKRSAAIVVSAAGVKRCLQQTRAFSNLGNIFQINNAVPDFGELSGAVVHHRKFILGVGRLMYVKGFDQLIEAFAMAELNDIDLIITGDGPEKMNLTCLALNLGLRDRVIFAGAKNNLQDYYSQAEMFVLPSRNEGYPNALVEAMSFGCPVIAMDCEFGPSEIISDPDNGLLVPAGDIPALSNAIVRLAGDARLKQSISNGAKGIKETNSKDAVLEKWERLIFKQIQ